MLVIFVFLHEQMVNVTFNVVGVNCYVLQFCIDKQYISRYAIIYQNT